MKVELEIPSETKDCPICSQSLLLSEFGICRARKDGRNLYCKSCIRKKVTSSRQILREISLPGSDALRSRYLKLRLRKV